MARKALNFTAKYKDSLENAKVFVHEGIRRRKEWMKPAVGVYKVNSDAAIFKVGKVGYGGIMKGWCWGYRGGTCVMREGCYGVWLGVQLFESFMDSNRGNRVILLAKKS
ncbi:hypothetical protein BVRB_2g039930 [Beta vulgaris subsp. vulgaris]|nr:hypothetical protein BVRB_2g039930 [Beta vulgaris subsp. vulgaris]